MAKVYLYDLFLLSVIRCWRQKIVSSQFAHVSAGSVSECGDFRDVLVDFIYKSTKTTKMCKVSKSPAQDRPTCNSSRGWKIIKCKELSTIGYIHESEYVHEQ